MRKQHMTHTSIQENNFHLRLQLWESFLPWYFALDMQNYARYGSYFALDMQNYTGYGSYFALDMQNYARYGSYFALDMQNYAG